MLKRLFFSCALAGTLFVLAAVFAGSAAADSGFNPGFQTLGVWEAERKIRMDVAVWYPTKRAPRLLQYDGWDILGARRAAISPGLHPLLLLSHGTAGSRFSLHQLAAALAREGFIVAAPTHQGDNIDSMGLLFSLGQLESRVRELRALPDILLADETFGPAVDAAKIGVIGFGPGGAAALLMAGGRLDGAGWGEYCHRAGRGDPYCSQWVAARMEIMAASIDPGQTYRDERIKAAAAVAPGYGMFFSAASLRDLAIPLLLLRADLDAVNRAPHHADAIRYALPQSPEYHILTHTDNAALLSPCAQDLARMLPGICIPSPAADRRETQRQLAAHISRFMLRHLDNNAN